MGGADQRFGRRDTFDHDVILLRQANTNPAAPGPAAVSFRYRS
jgi:hypothetical protein